MLVGRVLAVAGNLISVPGCTEIPSRSRLVNSVESVARFVNTYGVCVHNDFTARIDGPDSIFHVIHYSMCVQQTRFGCQLQMKLDEILRAAEACAQIMKAMNIGMV